MNLRSLTLVMPLVLLLAACTSVPLAAPPAKPQWHPTPNEWHTRATSLPCDDRVAPLRIDMLMPRYPPAAEQSGREQRLLYELRINSDGAVTDMRLLGEADAEFRSVADRAISQWRFHFAEADAECFVGKPMQLPVQFKMLD